MPKVTKALKVPARRRSAYEQQTLADYFRTIDKEDKKAEQTVAKAERTLADVGAASVPVMVMSEREGERTPAYLLDRGQYDAPDLSEELPRGVPVAFFEGDEEDQPQDRLELAR